MKKKQQQKMRENKKENDMQEESDTLLHDITSHIQRLYQICKRKL